MAFFSGPVRGGQIFIRVAILRHDEQTETAPPQRAYAALVDTGASGSCISPKVIAELGLISEGKRAVMSATETVDANLYHIDLHIPVVMPSIKDAGDRGHVQYSVFSRTKLEVAEITPSNTFDVLLGMDILAQCSLFVSGGQFTFCY